MDYKLKELRQKYERLKKSTEKPFKYNPERDWESENVQWSNYRDKLEKFSEAEKAFFEYLKEKKIERISLENQCVEMWYIGLGQITGMHQEVLDKMSNRKRTAIVKRILKGKYSDTIKEIRELNIKAGIIN